jgi:Domain of unknown function (DUF3846)
MGKYAVKINADASRIEQIGGDLVSLKKAVGGYIEIVPTPNSPFVMFCDEEGKIKGKPINLTATKLADRYRDWNDPIVGDVALVGPVDADGENADFTLDDLMTLFMPTYGVGREAGDR